MKATNLEVNEVREGQRANEDQRVGGLVVLLKMKYRTKAFL